MLNNNIQRVFQCTEDCRQFIRESTYIDTAVRQEKSQQLFLLSSLWQSPLGTWAEPSPQQRITGKLMPATTYSQTPTQAHCTQSPHFTSASTENDKIPIQQKKEFQWW